MYQNDAITQNTTHVNDVLVRIFKLILVFMLALVIMKAAGLIVLGWFYVAIMTATVILLCMIPIACRHFRMDAIFIKRSSIYCISVLCLLCYCYLNMRAIMLLVIPIGFACMYFDMNLVKQAVLIAAAGFALEEIEGTLLSPGFLASIQDSRIIIATDLLQLCMAAALLTGVSRDALRMQSNMRSLYENVNSLFSELKESSQSLESVEAVIREGVGSLAAGSAVKNEEEPPEEEAHGADSKLRTTLTNINRSLDNARELMKYSQAMLKGKGKELKAGDEIVQLEEYGRNTKALVSKLSTATDKIREDLKLIEVMIDETKLLSVNAAAEAENASDDGKGSVIVAMKVEKLAEESTESATHIQELLNSIVKDAECTVESISEAYEELFKSLELINRSVETLLKWFMYKNID